MDILFKTFGVQMKLLWWQKNFTTLLRKKFDKNMSEYKMVLNICLVV